MSAFEELPLDEPLPLILLVTGRDTERLRTLAKAALPMLLRPENFSLPERSHLAELFRLELEGECGADEHEYELGECLEWEEDAQ